jgi:hypothetical protein
MKRKFEAQRKVSGNNMRLKPGESASDFKVQDIFDQTVQLTDYKNEQAIESIYQGFSTRKNVGDKALIPADSLIGPDLIIEQAYYGKNIGDHLPISEIETWLNQDQNQILSLFLYL